MTRYKNRNRRWTTALGAIVLAVCTSAAQAAPYVMYKDPFCGCCTEWAIHARKGLKQAIQSRDEPRMDVLKTRLGVPADLVSCHTAVIGGYVIEGHVPAKDIARLLKERPKGVKGLAVAGMPLGSPGMEADGRVQPYEVIAFGRSGKKVFARYP